MDAKSLVVFAHKKVGLEVLKFLLERQYCIKALIIADDKQVEIENLALKWGIKFRIFNSNNLMDFLKSLGKIEWLVNAWSPHYLPKEILNLFTYRLNIHPSYAPYCLGNDNAAWAIMENRADPAGGGFIAGVCLLEMTEHIDEGGIWDRKKIICEFGIKGKELHKLLIDESIEFFKQRWEDIFNGKVIPKKEIVVTKHTREQTNRIKTLDAKDMIRVEALILNILANDFSPNFTSILKYEGEEYALTLELKKMPKV